jgi:hypothetical protein
VSIGGKDDPRTGSRGLYRARPAEKPSLPVVDRKWSATGLRDRVDTPATGPAGDRLSYCQDLWIKVFMPLWVRPGRRVVQHACH